ncbi:restriction endonuclease subunit S, partial [Escherichia coli]|nr:restriction endonuclease subunit S [Escherichia coli]
MSEMSYLEKLLDGVEVEWKTLGQTCKIETGKLNANAAVDDGEYMFFTTAKETSKIDKFRWDTEALLIAGNANVGEVKHYIGKFEAYQRTYVLTNFDENVSVRFLYFVLSHSLK